MRVCAASILAVAIVGCSQGTPVEPAGNAEANPENAEKKKAGINLMNPKVADQIQQFDPNAGGKVSDSKVTYSNPITGALEAYGPLVEKTSKMKIDHAVRLFQAEHGRYPKDLDEFMNRIIKPNDVKLPVLPGGREYQYDVENHRLVVVEKKDVK